MRADQLVRIRIVGDDVVVGRERNRVDRVGRDADSPWKLYRAVFVRIFQADIEDRGLLAPIQSFLQLFLGDPLDWHGAILTAPSRGVKVRSGRALRPGHLTRAKCKGSDEGRLLAMNVPPVRSLPAVDAAEEHGPRRAGDAVVVTAGEIAVQPVPQHMNLWKSRGRGNLQ